MLKATLQFALCALVGAQGNLIPAGSVVKYSGNLTGGSPENVINGNIYPGNQGAGGDCVTVVGPNPSITIQFGGTSIQARTVFVGAKDPLTASGGTYAKAPNGIANSRLSFIDAAGIKTICNKLVTGTGFYDCEASGVALEIENTSALISTELTVCEVRIYAHPNIIQQATVYASGSDSVNSQTKLLTKAPIQYEKGGATSWYQSQLGPPFWVSFLFPEPRKISDFIFIGDPDNPKDSKMFKVHVDSKACDGGQIQNQPDPQKGFFKEIPCNLVGNTVTATKEESFCQSAPQCFSSVGVAILESECSDCSQFKFLPIDDITANIDGGQIVNFNLNLNTCSSCPTTATLINQNPNEKLPSWVSWVNPNLVVNTALNTDTSDKTYQIKANISLDADPTITVTVTVTFTVVCTPTKLIMTQAINKGEPIVLVSDSSDYKIFALPVYYPNRSCPGNTVPKWTRALTQVSPAGTVAVSLFRLDLIQMTQIAKAFTANYAMQITTGIRGTQLKDVQNFTIKVIDCSINLSSDLTNNSVRISRDNPLVQTQIKITQPNTDPLCPEANYFRLQIMNSLPFVTFNSPLLKATYIAGSGQSAQQVTISAVYSLKFSDFKKNIVFIFELEADPCISTQIKTPQFPVQLTGEVTKTYTFAIPPLQDTVSLAKGIQGYCGAFITTLSDNAYLRIQGNNLVLYGTQPTLSTLIKLTITLSGLTSVPANISNLDVQLMPLCESQPLIFTSVPQSMVFVVGQQVLTSQQFVAGPTPQCGGATATYQAVFYDAVGKLVDISFAQFIDQRFQVWTDLSVNAGAYKAVVTASVLDRKVEHTWTLNVVDECLQTIINSDSSLIAGITLIVDQPSLPTRAISFQDTISQKYGDGLSTCGERTIELATKTSLVSVTGPTLTTRVAKFEDLGTHDVTLKVTLKKYPQVQALMQNLKVTVSLRCDLAVITATAAIKDMLFQIGQVASLQSLDFISDTESQKWNSPSVCGSYQYQLTPTLGFITIQDSQLSLKTNNSNNVGSYNMKLEVQLQNYPEVKKIYPFVVDVCESAMLIFSQTPELTTYTRGQGTYESSRLIATPAEVCRQKTTFSLKYMTSTGPVDSLSFLSFTDDVFKLETNKVQDVGSYEVIFTAQSLNQKTEFSWNFDITDPCIETVITGMVQSSFTVSVFGTPLDIPLSAVDSVSLIYGDQTGLTFCGNKTYALDGASTFASIKDGKLTISSQPVGTYYLSVVSTLSQYSDVSAQTTELKVEFVCVTESLNFVNRFEEQFTYTVGDAGFITPTWELVQTPACTNQVDYDLQVTRDGLEFLDYSFFRLVQMDDSIGFILIDTGLNSNAGTYKIKVIAKVGDLMQTEFSFSIVIKAYVAQILEPVTDMIYVIGQGVVQSGQLVLWPPVANQIAEYEVSYQLQSGSVDNLPFVTFEGARFTVEVTDHADVGTYTAQITTKVEDTYLVSEWKLQVLNLCAETVIQADENLKDVQLDQGTDPMAPTELVFIDSVSQQMGDFSGLTFCGPKVVSLIAENDILQLDGNTLTMRPVTFDDVGIHSYAIKVSMKNQPSALPLLQTFNVTVRCVVQQLAIQMTFTSVQYYDGDPTLVTDAILVEQTPDCKAQIDYEILVEKDEAVIYEQTFIEQSIEQPGRFKVKTDKKTDIGEYKISVKVALADKTQSAEDVFSLQILDQSTKTFCPDAQITATTLIEDMFFQIGRHPTVQGLDFISDSESTRMKTPNICGPYQYQLIPTLGFITIQDGQLILETNNSNNVGSYQMQLEVQLQDYPEVKKIYPFVVDVCESAMLIFSQTPELTTYTRGQGTYESSRLIATPAEVCRQKTTFSLKYMTSTGPVDSLSFLSFTDDVFKLETNKVQDVGSYEVMITATSISQQVEYSWKFDIIDPCIETVITSMVQSSFTVSVFGTPLDIPLSAVDSVSLIYGDQTGLTFCGSKTYALDGASTFTSIKDGKLTISSQPVGTYYLSVISTLSQYPNVSAQTTELKVEFVCVAESLNFVNRYEEQFTYTVGDAGFITPTWELVQTPACTNQVDYVLQVTRDGLEFLDNSFFRLVQMDDSIGFISIDTGSNSNAGTYHIKVIAKVGDLMQTEFSFSIMIKAYVAQISEPVTDMIYVIGQGVVQSGHLVLWPPVANQIAEYEVTYQLQSGSVDNLPFVTFEGARFTVEVTDHADVGTYTAQITTKVEDTYLVSEWKLQVLNLCAETVIQADENLKDVQLDEGTDPMAPTELVFIDSVSQQMGDFSGLTFCGPKVVSLIAENDILQLDGNTLLMRPVTFDDVGIHSYAIKVSMENQSSALPLLQTFNVTVRCVVQQLAILMTFTSVQYYDGDPTLMTDAILVEQTPDCKAQIDYEIFVEKDEAVIYEQTFIEQSIEQPGRFKVKTDKKTDIGEYKISVKVSLADKTQSAEDVFSLQILDQSTKTFCPDAQITATTLIEDMFFQIGRHPTVQGLDFISDSESTRIKQPNICGPYQYQLIPTLGFITIQDGQLILQTNNSNNVGSYQMQLEVQLQDYPEVKQTYPFFFDVCESAILIFSQTPELTTYTRGQGTYESRRLIATPAEVCRQKTTFSLKYMTNTGPVDSLSFLSFTDDIFKLNTNQVKDVGSYEVIFTAQSLNQKAEQSWKFDITDPCIETVITGMVQSSFTVSVFGTPLDIPLSAFDSVSLIYGDQTGLTFCGSKIYALDGASTFASIKDGKLMISSQPVGTYYVRVFSTLSQYSDVSAQTTELKIEFVCVTESLNFINRFEEQFTYTVGDAGFITPNWELVQTPACTNQIDYDLIVTRNGLEFLDDSLFRLVRMDDSIGFVSIETGQNSKAATYQIKVIAKVGDLVQTDFSFSIVIDAYVAHIWQHFTDTIYVIGEGVVQSEQLILWPPVANEIAEYEVTYQIKSGQLDSLPFVKFDGARFTVEVTDHADVGTYTAQITTKVEDTFLVSKWTLQVWNLCAETVIQADENLRNLQFNVGEDIMAPTELVFIDSVSQQMGDFSGLTFCGPKVVSLIAENDILQLDGNTLTMRPVTFDDVGIHSYAIKVSMENQPSALPLLQTFNVTVRCVVKQLAIQMTFMSVQYFQGDSTLLTDAILVEQTPGCKAQIDYEILVEKDGAIIYEQTFIEQSIEQPGRFKVKTDKKTDIGEYKISVKVSLADKTQSAEDMFSLFIKDQSQKTICSESQITATTSLNDMLFQIGQQTTVQALDFISDSESERMKSSKICGPYKYKLTPALGFITIQDGILSLKTNNSNNVGSYQMQLEVQLQDYPEVKDKFSFNVAIVCIVSNIQFLSSEINFSYTIGSGLQQIKLEIQAHQTCGSPIIFSIVPESQSFLKISQDILSIDLEDRTFAGDYSLQLQASLNQNRAIQNLNISIVDPCLSTKILNSQFHTDMAIKIQGDRVIYHIPLFPDSISQIYGDKQGFSYCGPKSLKLVDSPSFISLYGQSIELQTDLPSDKGFYEIDLVVSLDRYPRVPPLTKKLNLTVICENTLLNLFSTIEDFTYEIGSQIIITDKWQAVQSPSCGNRLSYQVSVTKQGNSLYAQNVFLFMQERLHVYTTSPEDAGVYRIKVQVELEASKTTFMTESFTFDVTITNPIKIVPLEEQKQFSFEIPDQKVKAGEAFFLKVQTPDELTVVVVNVGSANFVEYDAINYTLNIQDGNTRNKDAGVYNIKVRWVTPDLQIHERTFLLWVIAFEGTTAKDETQKDESVFDNTVTDVNLARTDDQVQQVVSNIRTKLLRGIKPSSPSFIEPLLSQTTHNGIVSIRFSRPLNPNIPLDTLKTGVYDESKARRNLQDQVKFEAIQVLIVPGNSSTLEELKFSWEFVGFKSNSELDLKLTFMNPSAVSSQDEPDRLQVKFTYSELFFDNQGNYVRPNAQITRELPPQIDNTEFNAVTKSATTVQAITGTAVSGNFIFNMFAASSLNYLWSMINAEQIIVLCPLLRVNLPANATLMFNTLLAIASFDLIPTDKIYQKLNLFQNHQGTLEKNFRAMSFNSELFIPNAGAQFLAFLLICAGLIFIKSTYCCKLLPCFGLMRLKLKEALMWNSIIRLAIECYVFVVLCCLINLKNASFQDAETASNTVLSMIFLTATIAYPIGILFFLRQKHSHLKRQISLDKFGEVYKELAVKKGPHILNYTMLFYARRLILPIMVIFSRNFEIQFSIFVASVVVNIAFVATYRPFKEPKKHLLEQVNEIVIFVILYHMHMLYYAETAYGFRNIIGVSCCFIVLISLLVNIGIMIEESIASFIRYCEIKYQLFMARRRLSAKKKEQIAKLEEHVHRKSIRRYQLRRRLMQQQADAKAEDELILSKKPSEGQHSRTNSSDQLLSTDASSNMGSQRSDQGSAMTLINLISRKNSNRNRTKIAPIIECQEEDQQSPPRLKRSPGKFWRLWSANSENSSPLSRSKQSPMRLKYSQCIEDESLINSGISKLRSQESPDSHQNRLEQSKDQILDKDDQLDETATVDNMNTLVPVDYNVNASIVSQNTTRNPTTDLNIEARRSTLNSLILKKRQKVCPLLEELYEENLNASSSKQEFFPGQSSPKKQRESPKRDSASKRHEDTDSQLSRIIDKIVEHTPEKEPSLPNDDSVSQCSQLKSVAKSNLMRSALKEYSAHSPTKENASQKSKWRLNFRNDGTLEKVLNVNESADENANDIENQRSALHKAGGQILNSNNPSPEKYGGTEVKQRKPQQNFIFEVINHANEPQTPIKRALFAIQKPQTTQKSQRLPTVHGLAKPRNL